MRSLIVTKASASKLPDCSDVGVIECRNVAKEFHWYEHRTVSIREWFIRTLRRQPIHVSQSLFKLTDFNLWVDRGESVALIGANGSGKSTALRLIAGIYGPSAGMVRTVGRIAAVLELGAGFNMELTGSENVELYASIMGLTRIQLATRYPEIIEFSEIAEFIDVPVKYYSSGMISRLAFSVALCLDPDILILDEVLAVGDQFFREKCFDRLRKFRSSGGTMVVVSHNFQEVMAMCARAVWLENGTIRMDDEVGAVIEAYQVSKVGAGL